jgi:hypothetical protein
MYRVTYFYRGHKLYLWEWSTRLQKIIHRRFNIYTDAFRAGRRFALIQAHAGHPVDCYLEVGPALPNNLFSIWTPIGDFHGNEKALATRSHGLSP